jgi:hypothetical protein
MRPLRLAALALILIAATGVIAPAAHGSPWSDVKCDEDPNNPDCLVTVIDPGGGFSRDGVGTRNPACYINDHEVPCHDPALGWLHADGCYYSPAPEVGPGPHWWARWCYNPTTDEYASGGWRWLLGAPTSIENVVQHAVDRIAIPQPAIATNPGLNAVQVVHVPVWWWIEPAWWTATRTAAASIPALTITAQAEPTSVTWHAGDGTSRTCTGPGTPWTTGNHPAAASPTCGHTYTSTSRTSGSGTYTLRAEVTWTINWSGDDGTYGSVPPLTTTTTTTITVTELRAVVTG